MFRSHIYQDGDEPIPGYVLEKSSAENGYIACGGFGEVWKARHRSGARYAVKFIFIDHSLSRDRIVSRLLPGICGARHLSHVFLLPIYGVWLIDRDRDKPAVPYDPDMTDAAPPRTTAELAIVMRLCDRSLKDELEKQPNGLDAGELLTYMEQTAEALDYLNRDEGERRAVRHGDVKPANILLLSGQIQVCDYDLAAYLVRNPLTTTLKRICSMAYAPPEILRPEPEPTPVSDLYSLAMTYFQLRCGRLPFDADSEAGVLIAAMSQDFDFDRLSENVAELEVVRQALARHPDDRYPDCRSFTRALRSALFHTRPSKTDTDTAPTILIPPPPATQVPFADLIRPGVELIPQYHLWRRVSAANAAEELWEAIGPREATFVVEVIGRDAERFDAERGRLAPWMQARAAVDGAVTVRDDEARARTVSWSDVTVADVRAAIGAAVVRSVRFASLLHTGSRLVPGHALLSEMGGGVFGGTVWEAVTEQHRRVRLEAVENTHEDVFAKILAALRGEGRVYWVIDLFGRAHDRPGAPPLAAGVVVLEPLALGEILVPGAELVPGHTLLRPASDLQPEIGGQVWEVYDKQGQRLRLETLLAGRRDVPRIADELRHDGRTFWLLDAAGAAAEPVNAAHFDPFVGLVLMRSKPVDDLLVPGRVLVPGHTLVRPSADQPGRLRGEAWVVLAEGGTTCELEVLSEEQFPMSVILGQVRDANARRWFVLEGGKAVEWSATATPNIPAIRAVALKWRRMPAELILPDHELVPGYRLRRKLDFGTGEVWKAYGPGNWPCALRIELMPESADRDLPELKTLRLWQQLQHPNLLELKQSWLIDEFGSVLAGEWKPGQSRPILLVTATELPVGSLLDKLQEERSQGGTGIPLGTLLEYMRQAADAVDYLHSDSHRADGRAVSIVHQNIRPETLLVSRTGALWLTDFGLSRMLDLGRSRVTAGTGVELSSPYVAPEVLRDRRALPASDLYSLAISYYHLRTGTLPLAEGSPLRQFRQQAQGRLDLSRLKNAAERDVIAKATHPEPGQRFASCVEFVNELSRAVQAVGGGSTGTGWSIFGRM